jgi:hypothetical protein
LAYAAWLSVRGKDEEQRRLAADFMELILKGRKRLTKRLKGFMKKSKRL